MRRILVAVDFTPNSDRAFDRAVQLAAQHHADLTAVHIIDAGTEANAVVSESLASRLHAYSGPSGVSIERRIEIGPPGPQIAKLACDTAPDLIVLGVHHRRPMADLIIESVATCVARRCNVPILVVTQRVQGPYGRILVATDFSPCAKRALHAAVMLAPTATLNVLHVYQTPFPAFIHFSAEELQDYEEARRSQIESDIREEMDRFIKSSDSDRSPTLIPVTEHRDTDPGIVQWIKQHNPDVVAMGMSGRGFAALVGSRTSAFLNDPIRDLLVVS